MNGFDWYVIQAHPRKEPFVKERLADLGREAFLPLVTERRRGRRRGRIGPLFPCYLFARLSEEAGDLPRARWMHGVRRVLGTGERPVPVTDAVIETIRSHADQSGKVRLGRRMRRGQRVRILDGPFAGLVGLLERPATSPEERVCVLLDLFHRPTRVELSAEAVDSAIEVVTRRDLRP